jgi:hypothetical protein
MAYAVPNTTAYYPTAQGQNTFTAEIQSAGSLLQVPLRQKSRTGKNSSNNHYEARKAHFPGPLSL